MANFNKRHFHFKGNVATRSGRPRNAGACSSAQIASCVRLEHRTLRRIAFMWTLTVELGDSACASDYLVGMPLDHAVDNLFFAFGKNIRRGCQLGATLGCRGLVEPGPST